MFYCCKYYIGENTKHLKLQNTYLFSCNSFWIVIFRLYFLVNLQIYCLKFYTNCIDLDSKWLHRYFLLPHGKINVQKLKIINFLPPLRQMFGRNTFSFYFVNMVLQPASQQSKKYESTKLLRAFYIVSLVIVYCFFHFHLRSLSKSEICVDLIQKTHVGVYVRVFTPDNSNHASPVKKSHFTKLHVYTR